MAFNPLSGTQGSVKIGLTSYAFGKWGVKMSAKALPVNNFNSNNRQQVVAGVTKEELTLEALTYDLGNMAFTAGNNYTFILGFDATHSLTRTYFVEDIEVTVDYDGLQSVKLTCQSNDTTFTAAIT